MSKMRSVPNIYIQFILSFFITYHKLFCFKPKKAVLLMSVLSIKLYTLFIILVGISSKKYFNFNILK